MLPHGHGWISITATGCGAYQFRYIKRVLAAVS
jgi:hypothetical protein